MNPNPEDHLENAESAASAFGHEAKETVKSAAENLKQKGQEVAGNLREKLSAAGESVRSTVSDLRDKVADKMHDLGEGASHLYEQARARVRTVGDDSVEFVRENPLSTVLTTFAVGVVLGYALHRSHVR